MTTVELQEVHLHAELNLHSLETMSPTSKAYYIFMLRSSHRRFIFKKSVLKNFAKFTWKHLRPVTLFKKNFTKFSITPFYRTPLDDCFCFLLSKGSSENFN